MTWDELEAEMPRLLEFVRICGARPADAPALMGKHLAPTLNKPAQDVGPSRVAIYRGVVDALRADRQMGAVRTASTLGAGGWRGRLTTFAWEQRAALFLMIGLEFSLKSVAEIFRAEPSEMAVRIERSLGGAPRRSGLDKFKGRRKQRLC